MAAVPGLTDSWKKRIPWAEKADSFSILFNHRSFQKPAVPTWLSEGVLFGFLDSEWEMAGTDPGWSLKAGEWGDKPNPFSPRPKPRVQPERAP